MKQHQSVMLEEAVTALDIKPEGIYIDATFGRGGHSQAILSQLGPKGKLIVVDKDPQAIAVANELKLNDPRVEVFQGSFKEIAHYCEEIGVFGKVDGVLFDLGVSSPQLDQAERGFSFMREGPLDMRMDPTKGVSASDWVNSAKEQDIVLVLKKYGEERFAKRIARAIIEKRETSKIETTKQFADLVTEAIPFCEKGKHPATRTFQGVRIYINQELEDLTSSLDVIIDVLAEGGRMVTICFHSLEDRIVKRFIQKQVKGDDFPPDFPVTAAELNPKLRKIGKALKPSHAEIQQNVRARSAVLRVAEKLKEVAICE